MRLISIFLIVSVVFFCCQHQVTEPKKEPNKLYINIKDAQNNPVQNVGLHFYYKYWEGENNFKINSSLLLKKFPNNILSQNKLNHNYPNPFGPLGLTTMISFSLIKTCYVKLQILDWIDTTTVIRALVDGNRSAGMYTVSWNGFNNEEKHVTNNFYKYRLKTENFNDTKTLFQNITDPATIKSLNCIPLASSDDEGNIELNLDIFPINHAVQLTGESGDSLGILTIPDSINIVLIKKGYLTIDKLVVFEENKPLELSYTIIKEPD